MTQLPIELVQARQARELAWDKYIEAINAEVDSATRQQYFSVVNTTEERARIIYSEWMDIGGTSNIETIALHAIDANSHMTGEQADIIRWQNEPDFQDEPKEAQPKIDFNLMAPIEF